jgi:CubicO group peptidase (beta-lactamase class C family)
LRLPIEEPDSMNFGNGLVSLLICLSASAFACIPAEGAEAAGSNQLAKALANLDPYIKESMEATKVPGLAVAVVYQDQVVFLKGYGVRKLGSPARIDPDTIFELASFSKPISTTVVAAVVGRGEVSWDTRIKQLDPSFELSNSS